MKPEGNYLYFFLNSAVLADNPLSALTLFFLFLGRFFPIIALSPFLGARVLPHPTKVVFGISMFAIFLPHLITVTKTPVGFDLNGILLLVKEIFVGTVLGFIMSMPFTIVQNVGIIIDHQRGGASLMVNDPTIQNQSSPLGTLFNMVLIFLFFLIDGPFLFFNAIINSYDVIPPDRFLPPEFFAKTSTFWEMMIQIFNKVMVVSMQLAAPALLAILMADLFLGIANRLAPQVQITFLGMPLKSLLALVVVCFGWRLFNDELIRQLYKWLDTLKETLMMMASTAPHSP